MESLLLPHPPYRTDLSFPASQSTCKHGIQSDHKEKPRQGRGSTPRHATSFPSLREKRISDLGEGSGSGFRGHSMLGVGPWTSEILVGWTVDLGGIENILSFLLHSHPVAIGDRSCVAIRELCSHQGAV
jgi:hypothetical protein